MLNCRRWRCSLNAVSTLSREAERKQLADRMRARQERPTDTSLHPTPTETSSAPEATQEASKVANAAAPREPGDAGAKVATPADVDGKASPALSAPAEPSEQAQARMVGVGIARASTDIMLGLFAFLRTDKSGGPGP